MSRSRFVRLAYAGLVSIAAFAAEARAGQILLPEKVFAPFGFDSNDNAQLVLFGHFPDTCYQSGPADARVNGSTIEIRNTAHRRDPDACLQAKVPWSTTIDLGPLRAGRYAVFALDPEGRPVPFGALVVHPALTRRTDDYPYAYVNGASVDRSGEAPMLTISGTYNLTCMDMRRIRIHADGDVIVVQPIVYLRRDVPCGHPFLPIPFTKRIRLEWKPGSATLVHIRSMNGQAVNQVIE